MISQLISAHTLPTHITTIPFGCRCMTKCGAKIDAKFGCANDDYHCHRNLFAVMIETATWICHKRRRMLRSFDTFHLYVYPLLDWLNHLREEHHHHHHLQNMFVYGHNTCPVQFPTIYVNHFQLAPIHLLNSDRARFDILHIHCGGCLSA